MRNPFYNARVFDLAVRIAHSLPQGVSRGIATMLGRAAATMCRTKFGLMRGNLEVITQLKHKELDFITRRNFENFLSSLADYCRCYRAPASTIYNLVDSLSGREYFETPAAQGGAARGRIFATVHLGNWELGGLYVAMSSNKPFAVLTQREPDDALHAWRSGYRTVQGVKTITIGEHPFSILEAVEILRAGGQVAVLVDRPLPGSGQAVEFFGRETYFTSGCELLARHSGASIVPVYVVRGASQKYSLFALPPISESGGDKGGAAQALAAAFEPVVRKHAEEYYNYSRLFASKEN